MNKTFNGFGFLLIILLLPLSLKGILHLKNEKMLIYAAFFPDYNGKFNFYWRLWVSTPGEIL